ncbi:glycosyltransferase [Candidatus Nanopelagicales bacterium]|nr:glycosyltransferase [Candidatus Nanopelagicales bacterium]
MTGDKRPRVGLVLPVFNDWDSFRLVANELEAFYSAEYELHLCVVNDGSTLEDPDPLRFSRFASLEVVNLGANLGHQRAICVGLVRLADRGHFDAVVIMDSDGEDSVAAVGALLEPVLSGAADVVVAQRTSRSEGKRFRAFYSLYKFLFRVLTGERLDFGNFSALSARALDRMVFMPDLWNHYPGTVMRSRLAVTRVPVARLARLHGRSKMDLASLTTHGLSGLSVFVDRIFARLLILVGIAGLMLLAVVGAGLVARLALQVPIAGWLALLTTAAFIGLIQLLGTLAVLAFVSLSMRSLFSPPPSEFAANFVRDVSQVSRRDIHE